MAKNGGYATITKTARFSRKLANASDGAERLFFRLLLAVDAYGTHSAEPWDVLTGCFPFVRGWDEGKVSECLDELHAAGLLHRWDNEGAPWLGVANFDENLPRRTIERRPTNKVALPANIYGKSEETIVPSPKSHVLTQPRTKNQEPRTNKGIGISPMVIEGAVRKRATLEAIPNVESNAAPGLDFHIKRLLDILTDKTDGTARTVCKLIQQHKLAPADIEYAREVVAESATVKSPTRMAVSILKQRAAER
jgi:hypothetical protein